LVRAIFWTLIIEIVFIVYSSQNVSGWYCITP
jgi:hypothetical protein